MEDTERWIRTWVASPRQEEIDKIVEVYSNRQITLLNIIKALGDYLPSEDGNLRSKGVQLLSSVLEKCSAEVITRKSAHVLATFYITKLDDTDTIIPALQGLACLTKLAIFPEDDTIPVMKSLFSYVKMKVLVQGVRYHVFTIIDNLLSGQRKEVRSMGGEFTRGYLALADGEKDPRNLLIAFAIDRVILIEFEIQDFVESLFNITFCYFPITFRPPPNDPYGIRTEDLRLSLRRCLNATPSFGPLAIPVFLEKLAAGSPATKRDALETISESLPVYGPAVTRNFAKKLWNSLKLEVFQPTDSQTEQLALRAVQILVKTIYTDQKEGNSDEKTIEGLAQEACAECIEILEHPERTLAKPAVKVLCTFLSTTPLISKFTLSQCILHLVDLFVNTEEAFNRPSILLLLSDLIAASRDSTKEISSSEDYIPPLEPYKDEIIGVATSGLKQVAMRKPAIACFLGLTSYPKLISDEEFGFIVHNTTEALRVAQEEEDDSSESLLNLLSTISMISSHHVVEQTLPMLFSSLPENPLPQDAVKERSICWNTLDALKTLCQQRDLFETMVVKLTTRLELLCFSEVPEAEWESYAAYVHSILTTIAQTLDAKVQNDHVDVEKYIDRLVPRLFNLFIYSALVLDGTFVCDFRILKAAGRIVTLVVGSASVPRQEKFALALFSLFLEGKYSDICAGHQAIPSNLLFFPFAELAPLIQRKLCILFAAAVIPLRQEIRMLDELDAFLRDTWTWSQAVARDIVEKEAGFHIIAAIVNKHPEECQAFLDALLGELWSTAVILGGAHGIKAWSWVCKALFIRNHPSLLQYCFRLFELFENETLSWDAAKAIGFIVSNDAILTKKNHAVVKILHAQKYVNSILPRILAGTTDSSKPKEQIPYLVALTALIKSSPKSTYSHAMATLIPLLLRGLELPDNNIKADIINTLLAAAEGDSPERSLISEHASSLVSIMLKNSMISDMPTTRVRVAALKYLGVIPRIVRYDILHPKKSLVTKELAKALDDPKRVVRIEAVESRTNWFKLGA